MAAIPTASGLLGGFVIEACLALLLYGIATAQAYVYMLNSRDDPRLLRWVVAAVWLLETLHSALIMHMVYEYTITDFGKLALVGEIVWSVGLTVLVGMMIVGLSQGFYVRRIWILSSHNIALTAFTALLLIARICFGVATAALTYSLGAWAVFREKKGPLFTLSCGLGLSAAVDALIAGIIIFYLQKGQTGFKSTDNIIRSLMAYAVNSGAITMVVSIVIVLTFVFLKNSLVFAGFVTLAGKLYSNSFLGTLNARSYLRGKSQGSGYQSAELSNMGPGRSKHPQVHVSRPNHIEIYKETTKVFDGSSFAPVDEESSSTKNLYPS
ncbi:hypothetical protein QCA50_007786 [Cerrena zonata]|uniref:DUF6534 domain-containing protein n=1 Tax=Cerrena zonata TaxID=2478898 RepID=A0AAW0GJ94_9APHY